MATEKSMTLISQIILILLNLIGASCEDDTNQISEKESFVQSVLLPDTVQQGEKVEIEFELLVSGCWTYSRLEKEINGQTISLKVFINNSSRNNVDVNCPTGFFTETIKEQVILNSSGRHDLTFNDSTLLKKIFVTN